MNIDLHVHTTASDGIHAPSEVVRLADSRGLSVIGIADHDTVNGIDEARAAASERGICVVPAVEINSYRGATEFHILGYFIDHRSGELREALAKLRQSRVRRMHAIISKLEKLGIILTPRDVLVLSQEGAIGRPHIAQALVKKGHARSVRHAFDTLIGEGKPAYAPRSKTTPEEAITLIRRAGGIAVLAHPGLRGADGEIPRLAAAGLGGIEVYSPAHTHAQAEHYLETARSLGLCATGGSDYHGWNDSPRRDLGSALTPPEELNRLRAMAVAGG